MAPHTAAFRVEKSTPSKIWPPGLDGLVPGKPPRDPRDPPPRTVMAAKG